jgi:hypothetical protein
MNASPEGRTLTRYAVTAVLGIIALIIGTRAYVGVVFGWIVVGAGALGTRVVYAAPLRFAHRNATLRLTVVWYLFLAEIIAGATAFAPVFDRRGSPAVAIAALVVAFVPGGHSHGAPTHRVRPLERDRASDRDGGPRRDRRIFR